MRMNFTQHELEKLAIDSVATAKRLGLPLKKKKPNFKKSNIKRIK